MLAITSDNIRATLQARYTPSQLEVIDESADHAGHSGNPDGAGGTHYRVRIASADFVGKSRVAQHRLVYAALQPFIDQGLHALAIDVLPMPAAAPLVA